MSHEPKLTPVEVPAASLSSARIARWNKGVGDLVVANETLVILEGQGGSIELPAPASGVLVRIDKPFGDPVDAGELIGMIEVGHHATRVLQASTLEPLKSPSAFAAAPAVTPLDRPPKKEPLAGPRAPQGRALTRKLAGFGTTIFTEMSRLAVEHGAINLAQGFPDFDGPEHVKEAAISAIRSGASQYAPMGGLPKLQTALADKYERLHGLRYQPGAEVTVTAGATEAIFAALQGLCDVGDEVILFEPYYDSYRASVCMAGASPRAVTLHTPDWRFDADELRRAFSPRTRAIVVNTPHNPTGKVFAREELELIAALCIEHDVVCITDEVYEHLVFEGAHLPMASLPGMRERTITISSLGKTYSLTGWKVGWSLAPPVLTQAIRAAHQFVTFAVATPLQHGAIAAVESPPEFYAQLLADYRARRDLLAEGLSRAGLDVRLPAGSYFICADIRVLGHFDDIAFCKELIERVGVAAIPPSVFYERSNEGKTYVRFAFCKKLETLQAAVERLARLSA